MNLAKRSYEKELLDRDDIPFADIRLTMQELNTINTLLGGHSITCRGISSFLSRLQPGQPITVAEIGCGGGDNLTAVYRYLERRKQAVDLVGVDIKEECVQYAVERTPHPCTWICSDYRTTPWPNGGKPDVIFSSLFCHHFTDEQMVEQLQWLRANSRMGFFINDIHRHPLAYHSIKLLTRLFSKSYLVRNDASLSVERSFRKDDWQRLMTAAGIKHYTISWHWAFRYLVTVHHG